MKPETKNNLTIESRPRDPPWLTTWWSELTFFRALIIKWLCQCFMLSCTWISNWIFLRNWPPRLLEAIQFGISMYFDISCNFVFPVVVLLCPHSILMWSGPLRSVIILDMSIYSGILLLLTHPHVCTLLWCHQAQNTHKTSEKIDQISSDLLS